MGTLNIADCYLHPDFDPKLDRETGNRTKAVLAQVIRQPQYDRQLGGSVKARSRWPIGILQAVNKEGGAAFSPEDEQMLSAIASELAIVTQLHRLSQERKTREQCTSNIVKAAIHMTTAGHSLPVSELLESVLETVGSVMSAAHVTLYLLKPGVGQTQRCSDWIAINSVEGPAAPFVVSRNLKVLRMAESKLVNLFREKSSGRLMVAEVLQSGMNDDPDDAEAPSKLQRSEAGLQTTFEVAACDGLDTVSVLALPLKNCLEHLVGVLEIRNKVGASVLFNSGDEQVATAIGYLCGGAIRNSQLLTMSDAKQDWAGIYGVLDSENGLPTTEK